MKNALKKNDVTELTAESLLPNGNALSHTSDGFVVFIPGAAPKERVSAKIIKVTKNYAVAKILEILQPSSERIEDGCPFAGKCGGCVFGHISYELESLYKKDMINDAFKRIGGLALELDEYIPAKSVSHYRNKAVYPVSYAPDGALTAGFYARNTHRIVAHTACMIANPEFDSIRDSTVEFLSKNRITAYDELTGKGLVRSIYLRSAAIDGSVSLTLVINGKRLADEQTEARFCEYITKKHPKIVTVLLNFNEKSTNAVLGEGWRTLCGEGCIYDVLCSKRFRITPASFWQVNHAQTEILYSKAREYAALGDGQTLLDLYCGTGTVGLCTVTPNAKLLGVEITPQAVEDARENARLNGIDADFLCLDAKKALDDERLTSLKPDVITIDPPRKGCAGAVDKIAALGAERIVYISCDPATLARDLAEFEKCGYVAVKACGVDMFPRTGHVECCVLLCRNDNLI